MQIVSQRRFIRDVTVMMPTDNGYVKENLKTRFNYMSVEEIEAFDLSDAKQAATFLNDKAVDDFLDLTDDDKQPVTCTPELRTAIINLPNARLALIAAYTEAVTKVKKGN